MRVMTMILLPLAAALLAACGGGETYVTHGTDRVPGADAEIVVTPLDSGNFRVDIDTEHMAPPNRLGEGLSRYVVWVRPRNAGEVEKLGFLPLDGSRSAEMYGTTVASAFEIVVTAEPNADVASPSEHVVLRQTAVMPVEN